MNITVRKSSLLISIILLGLTFLESGCASIVHGGNRDIAVRSDPKGAYFEVFKDGSEVAVTSGTTPMTISLDPKGGYFRGQTYRLRFEMPGYQGAEVTLRPSMSGWYFGNILFGGLIGMVIVDPLTGSMWNLAPEEIDQGLYPAAGPVTDDSTSVTVALLSEIPLEQRDKLVRIN